MSDSRIHTDRFKKDWDLLALADSFDMRLRTIFTNNHLTDEDMSGVRGLRSCSWASGPAKVGSLPISEALACGIPVITGDYAGATDFIPEGLRIKPAAFRYDGFFACKRPVFKAADWADKVESTLKLVKQTETALGHRASWLSDEFYWKNCWPEWEQWFRAGLKPEIINTDMVFAIATRKWAHWEDCAKSWQETASKAYPEQIEVDMNIVEAYQNAYEESDRDNHLVHP